MDLTVSICMYNAEKYIDDTLSCVLAQTKQDFHLLIIDDCSTDNSAKCVKDFFAKNQRQYELISFEQNQGIAYARNYAIHHATTKYFIFVDSDDFPQPKLLEKEYQTLASDHELMAVSSWSDFVSNRHIKIGGGLYIGDADKEAFHLRVSKNKLIFLPIQTMFERECALRVGGFQCEGFPVGKPRYRDYCEDLDLWTRMSDLYTEGRYIITIPETLYHYRKTDSLSANHFNMIIKMRYVKKNLLLRRSGQVEMTFTEFMNALSDKELRKLKNEAAAADCLRNGVFYLKERKLFRAASLIVKSIWYKPLYVLDKIKYNSGLKKK